jgi:hypothetical protein
VQYLAKSALKMHTKSTFFLFYQQEFGRSCALRVRWIIVFLRKWFSPNGTIFASLFVENDVL